jgi:hypothetical protein
MHATIIQALGEERIREWHEQAATDRLLAEARRARRAARRAGRPLPRKPALRPAPEVLDEPQVQDRQPVGAGRMT